METRVAADRYQGRIEMNELDARRPQTQQKTNRWHPNSRQAGFSVKKPGIVERYRSNRFGSTAPNVIAVLNNSWRVVDDPLQWILEVRKGHKRQRASGYSGRSYCCSRTALLRCIREHCGAVDPEALVILRHLPDRHPDMRLD